MTNKYKSLNINTLSFVELNNLDINQKSNELHKKILKSRIPIDLLRDMVYFYENNSEIFKNINEIKVDKMNTIFIENCNNLKKFKNVIKKIISQIIVYKYCDSFTIDFKTN
tara:strand:+ start:75 stop:407 length:333 start_codon:yes stop_codon:yes gene_type:complete